MSTNQTWNDDSLGSTKYGARGTLKPGFVLNSDIGLRRWRAALAKVKSGVNQIANVSVLGDSITEGGAAGNGATADYVGGNNYLNKGYVGKVRSALAAKYGDVGTGFIPIFYPKYGGFWTFSAGWQDEITATFGPTGLNKRSGTNGDVATFSFSGTGISIVLASGTGAGTFTASVDGGAATPFDSYTAGAAIGAKEFKITGLADGTHTLTLTSTVTGGKQLWLLGAYPIKGTSGVRVNMLGRWGTKVNNSIGPSATKYPLFSEIDFWSPALTIVAFTANDFSGQTDLISYRNDLQTIITRAKQFGDCLLVSTGLRNDVVTPTNAQSEYNKVLLNLAFENNIAFVDVINRWSGDANYAQNTLSFISSDNVHPGDYGHQDIATAILRVIDEY